jgi:HlyD family secretion protein
VTDVDRTANSSGGVTTYSAEITFAKEKGMLSGMSADVIVNIQGDENVLIVPADAIHRTSAGAFVYTSYDEETKTFGGNMPVEVGISNDDYAEIRSGIEEGTTVYYTEKQEDNFYMMMGGPGMNGRTGSNRR